MDILKEIYPITFLCQIMKVNRSGYYKWRSRKGCLNQYEKTRISITKELLDMHEKHPSYGYHRLARKIRYETGWIFSDNLAHKCCKAAGIKSKARSPQYRRPGNEHIVFPNTIRGKWNVTRPLEIVVSDMTVLKHRGKYHEWTYMLDVFDNSIIASATSSRQNDPKPYYKCLTTLEHLKENETAPTVLHTDQGAVYASALFNKGLDKYNINRSMSRAGTPTDNPVIESINGWLKAEMTLDYSPDEYNSIDEFLEDFIYYYNNERPAYALQYKTPAQYRFEQGFG